MLKGITVASLTLLLSGFSSIVLAQNNNNLSPTGTSPLRNPVKIEPVRKPGSSTLMKPAGPNRDSMMLPTNNKPASALPKPYPAGTPCGASVVNGQSVFVNPQSIPGSYCDRDGTLQYK
jgi:hypothetical protein